MEQIKVMLDEGAYMPKRAYEDDAGMDLFTPINFFIPEGGSAVVDTGIHVFIEKGYVGMLKSKSGLNVNRDLVGEGTIDCGYTGSIKVKLYNHGNEPAYFSKGDKIIQLVIMPIVTPVPVLVTEFPETDRGSDGFGSTGAR